MNHFEVSQWVDFARGTARPAERAAMKAHLLTRCAKCGRTAGFLRRVTGIALAEGKYQVPEHVVREVRAIFALQRPEKVSIFRRIVGRLLYDSFREPLPAGVRSRQHLTRQVMYQAAHYSLDLRLEHQHGVRGVTLVGQLADQEQPERPMGNLPVFLLCGNDLVAHAFSNDYGEFQLEYEPRRRLRLFIQANQGVRNRIEVQLSRIDLEDAANTSSSRRSGKQ